MLWPDRTGPVAAIGVCQTRGSRNHSYPTPPAAERNPGLRSDNELHRACKEGLNHSHSLTPGLTTAIALFAPFARLLPTPGRCKPAHAVPPTQKIVSPCLKGHTLCFLLGLAELGPRPRLPRRLALHRDGRGVLQGLRHRKARRDLLSLRYRRSMRDVLPQKHDDDHCAARSAQLG